MVWPSKLGVEAPAGVVLTRVSSRVRVGIVAVEMTSGLPSPLMSATVTPNELRPAPKAVGPLKLGAASPAGVVLSSTVMRRVSFVCCSC